MENDFSPIQIAILSAFVSAFLATRFLIAAHLNDSPDDPRKLHQSHKATSGGIAIMIGFGVACIYLLLNTNMMVENQVYVVFGSGILFGLIGFLDDLLSLKSAIRLIALFTIAAIIAYLPLRVENLWIFGKLSIPLGIIWGTLGTIIWVAYFVNAVNFMDGVNGIAFGAMAISFFGLAFLTFHHGDLSSTIMMLCLACASLGFLVFNVVQGSIFGGDTGSYFIGGTYAIMGLYAVRAGVSPFAVALCVLPIICETTLTILYRIKLGENILSAHNKHLYQKLVRLGKPHLYVASIWWVLTIFCVLIANIADIYNQNLIFGIFAFLVLIYQIGAAFIRPKLAAQLPN